MKKLSSLFILLLACCLSGCAQETVPDKDMQVKTAVMAAPEDQRAGATVYGYTNKGNLKLLREGSNKLICLSDDPDRPGFQAVCYHEGLEPFMARGRELKAEGKSGTDIFKIREAEAKSGKLKMPEQPTTLHLLEGKTGEFDPQTGKIRGANYRYVVYIPWATAESTGLPTQPMVAGGPWIMDPGTHKAHIMITPPPEN